MGRDTILILEDDDASRSKLVGLLKDKYKVIEVSNERDGVEVFRKHASSIAVVLVNLMIPAQDNFKVMHHLSKKGFLKRIPFIMITSEKTAEYEKIGYEYGIVSYIKKPIHSDALRQLVDNVVEVFQYKRQLEVTVKIQTEKLKKQNAMLKLMTEKQKQVCM